MRFDVKTPVNIRLVSWVFPLILYHSVFPLVIALLLSGTFLKNQEKILKSGEILRNSVPDVLVRCDHIKVLQLILHHFLTSS